MASDMVLDWNQNLIDAIRRDTTSPGPTWVSRNMAIVQLAVYDSVNAITQTHSSFATSATAPAWASKEAAVATAAHDTLVALYPAQKGTLDALWSQSLAAIPNGPAEDAGVVIGRRAAGDIMSLRAADNSSVAMPYVPGTAPGQWRPDPLNPSQKALGPNWGNVKPFAIDHPDDFQVPAPPALNSAEYAASFDEVKRLGARNSTERTADQTEIGIFWAYDRGGMGPPMVLYNQNVRTIAEAKGNSLEENARLFALVNLAMADAGVTAWNTKYEYHFWRPITAIREGGTDGNAQTAADPTWEPLGAPGGGVVPDFTPPFPAYTSGHATFGAAAFRTMAHFYGSDEFHFTLRSDELPGVVRSFDRFSEAAEENGISRIYLGIHWNFDNVVGQQQGNQIADHVAEHFLIPRDPAFSMFGLQRDGSGFESYQIDTGRTDITLRRAGDRLQVVDNVTTGVELDPLLSRVNAIRFDGRHPAADFLTIDAAAGGAFAIPGGVQFLGGPGQQDGLWYAGTSAGESVRLDNDRLKLSGINLQLPGVRYVGLATNGGNDQLTVDGLQTGRRIDLLGGKGNDLYMISSHDANVSVSDKAGADGLNFSRAAAGVNVDLSRQNGQRQSIGGGNNTLELNGLIENLTGTGFNDRLRGNDVNNRIRGLAGNDSLWGEEGHDVLLGDEGNDLLHGGGGRDVLIGGLGRDTLVGDGQDILIGGKTSHDQNDTALQAILDEWSSDRSYNVRVANLTNGGGSTTRRNGNYFLRKPGTSATLPDDFAVDTILTGGTTSWVLSILGDTVRSS